MPAQLVQLTQSTDVTGHSDELPALARRINDEYEHVREAIGVAATHALAIGEMLVEAQTRVQHEGAKWGEWIEANLPFGHREASRYLKLAKDTPRIAWNETRVSDCTPPIATNVQSLRAGLLALTPPRETPAKRGAMAPKKKKRPVAASDAEVVIPGRSEYVAALLAMQHPDRRKEVLRLMQDVDVKMRSLGSF